MRFSFVITLLSKCHQIQTAPQFIQEASSSWEEGESRKQLHLSRTKRRGFRALYLHNNKSYFTVLIYSPQLWVRCC